MNARGWGWSASEIRQVRLAEWLAQSQIEPSLMCTVTEFYNDLPDQSQNTWDTAHGDLKWLEARGLISLHAAMGGIEGLGVVIKLACRDFVADARAQRENKGRRKAACRDAMVHWLHALDAVAPGPDMPVRDALMTDTWHGFWYAEPFSEADLDDAAAWLHRNGLVGGATADQVLGPVRLYLTDEGVRCAEDFDSDTNAYMADQRRPAGSGPIVNIGTNSGPFQVAGDNAHQVQNIGPSAEHLRELIVGLAELVRQLVPDAADIDAQQQAALAAAGDGAVDQSALRRFAAWVVSVVRTGATAAIVPVVTSGTDDMLREAARVAGHL